MDKQIYVHTENIHNLQGPRKIVPVINKMLAPGSVVDIGCGLGTFLFAFKEAGVKQVLGVDGPWVNRDLLKQYLTTEEFREEDLSKHITFPKKYDLAICLEVGEHIDAQNADNFVRTLTGASDMILFSAAIPYQGGQNHINEQWSAYWMEKFAKHGFQFYDIVRDQIWNDDQVEYWYKQNTYIVARNGSLPETYNALPIPQDHVHPDVWKERSKRLEDILELKLPASYYAKMLVKKLLGKK